jgi:hypothetical protein
LLDVTVYIPLHRAGANLEVSMKRSDGFSLFAVIAALVAYAASLSFFST